ncbi:MAG: hypothetical protein AAF495_20010 [Pseudomonadota bacterium]
MIEPTVVDSLVPPPSVVLDVVEGSFRSRARNELVNPAKIYTKLGNDGIAISMLATHRAKGFSVVKNYFESSSDSRHRGDSFAHFTVYSESGEAPLLTLNDSWITNARSSAVSTLMIRELATFGRGRVVILGLGKLGLALLDFLPFMDSGDFEAVGFSRKEETVDRWLAAAEQRETAVPVRAHNSFNELMEDLAGADVVIATTGAGGIGFVQNSWLPKKCLSVYVGYGFAANVMHETDRLYTTSQAQMEVTCPELRDSDGKIRNADLEFHEILMGRTVDRVQENERVFAYNSGLAVNDLALVEHLVTKLNSAELVA